MDDRDIEDTKTPPDEEEQFECTFCEFLYPVSVDHKTIELYVKKAFGRGYEEKIICVTCSDKISEEEEMTEEISTIKYDEVTLEYELRADCDGMPVFRKCFEHEILLSFYSDDGAYGFRDWWEHKGGSVLFNSWMKSRKETK